MERRGTVYIAWLGDEGHYTAYWDAEPDAEPTLLEQGPEVVETNVIVEWARSRASRILVRPRADPNNYYWAGDGPPPPGTPRLAE